MEKCHINCILFITLKIKMIPTTLFTFETSDDFLQDESPDSELSTSSESLSENKQVSEFKSKTF